MDRRREAREGGEVADQAGHDGGDRAGEAADVLEADEFVVLARARGVAAAFEDYPSLSRSRRASVRATI